MHLGINTASIDISMQQNRQTVLVVFPDAERAAWYMDYCYVYYTRVLVVSMDGVYPYHHALKDSVERLWRDPDVSVVVFGSYCIVDDPPAGSVFNWDRWAIESVRKRTSSVHNSVASLDFAEDPASLARMIEIFANSQNNRTGKNVNVHNIKQENYDLNRLNPVMRKLIS